jgi:type IV secretory pathway VirB2 component (pilin)
MKKEISKILITAGLISAIASTVLAQAGGLGPLQEIIERIKNILQLLAFVVAVIFIMLGGYSIITAGGSAEKVETGRKWILYAIVGLVVILIAEVLARLACFIGTGSWTCG